jgi:hypothetical protein
MTLPKLTTKQQEITRLLFRYRFLDRTHIQTLLHHKDKRRVISWLKDLREKQYVEWIYDSDNFAEKTKPAIYYLGLNDIRLLRTLNEYSSEELRKRYKEATRQKSFVDRCLLLADCCLSMEARTANDGSLMYLYVTEADYADPDNAYYFLNESEFVHPNLCYTKTIAAEDGQIVTNNLLEVFDMTTPRYMVKKKLKGYVDFLDSDEWEQGTGDGDLPIILIACPTKAELIYAKRYSRKLLEDIGQEDNEDICIRFATVEQIKEFGMTGGIWEDI